MHRFNLQLACCMFHGSSMTVVIAVYVLYSDLAAIWGAYPWKFVICGLMYNYYRPQLEPAVTWRDTTLLIMGLSAVTRRASELNWFAWVNAARRVSVSGRGDLYHCRYIVELVKSILVHMPTLVLTPPVPYSGKILRLNKLKINWNIIQLLCNFAPI